MSQFNTVFLSGNLTADPRLSESGKAAFLRIAVNRRVRQGEEWVDGDPLYLDATVFNGRGKQAAEKLSKGSPVTIQGSLEPTDRTANDGTRYIGVRVLVSNIESPHFLNGNGGSTQSQLPEAEPVAVAAEAAATGGDDDIPF